MWTWLQSHVTLPGVDALVEPSLHLADSNPKRADEHRYGRVRDVVRNSGQANDDGVVRDVDKLDRDAPHVEAVSAQVLETLSPA